MGDRANYVVMRDGSWELYYSHWGAVGLHLDLLPGPDAATAFVTAQRRVGPDEWLDDVWGEGGAVIDHDRKVLLFYFLEFEGYAARAAVLEVLRRTWSGWEVRWAHDGQGDLVSYVGRDPASVHAHDPGDLEPPEPFDPGGGWPCCAVTVGGRSYALANDPSDLLEHGPDLVGMLPKEAETDRFPLPESGIHFDVDERSVGVWAVLPLSGALRRAAARWPEWRWTLWEDRYEEQVSRAGVTFPAPDMAEEYAALRERLVRHRDSDRVSVAHEMMRKLAEDGGNPTPSPYLFEHQEVHAPDAHVLAVIDALAGP
ncbi:hypothetical protein [Actinomadura kijaniata]|uniref:hypothetical protein n=1 Tax=Actinomadura kijaniata TaxID=46161 RepID=UPI00082D42CD|nr:hypothetical protein [Actinomadura kijaniata]